MMGKPWSWGSGALKHPPRGQARRERIKAHGPFDPTRKSTASPPDTPNTRVEASVWQKVSEKVRELHTWCGMSDGGRVCLCEQVKAEGVWIREGVDKRELTQ